MQFETKPNSFAPRIAFALASLFIAALLIFLFLPRNTGPFRALPAQSSLVLECKGLLRAKTLTDKTPDPHWKAVLHSPLFEHCFQDVDALIKLLGHDEELLRAFVKNKALAAYSLHPADSLNALFAIELDEDFNLENGLKTNKLTPKYFSHQFHGNDIFNVHLSKTEQIEVAVSGRILLFSRKATLVEDALAQLENARNWWTDRPYIAELSEAPLRLHLRPSALAEQVRSQMVPRWRGLPDLLARNVEWAGLSWDGKALDAMLETNGFLSNLGTWGETPNSSIFNVLPDNTAFLARAGLAHIPDFFRQIGSGRSSEFEQYVLPWVGREAAFVVTEPLSPALSGDRLLLLAVQDSAKAMKSLRAFGKEQGALPNSTGAYQMFEVLGFQNSSLLKPLLGDDEAFRNPVCVLVDGFAVFAPDRSSLEIFLDKYLVNQTLAANTDFLQLQQKLPQQGAASILLNTAYLPSLLQNLTESVEGGVLAKTGFVGAELESKVGRKSAVTLASQPLSQPLSETDILWKSVFSAPVVKQPYLVEQPEGKMVVLAQDLKFKLYCLNAQNGAIVWSKSLSEQIVSDIKGIDFYRNGTKCYTFSTETQIYTIDENGRDVQGFPFKLPSDATNPVTVVDFDLNTKFNYFVACGNGKIYGFGYQGKPLEGWNALPINGISWQPILHFQHKGKDYLAVLNDTGLLSVFGRDGTLRFKSEMGLSANAGHSERFVSPMEVDVDSPTPHIYCANTKGKIFACDLQGRVSSLQVGKSGSAAAFGQLTGDARYEWAVLDGNSLTLGGWGKDGASPFFKTQFSEKQGLVFFSKNNSIGTVEKNGRHVWLLDNKGKAAAGFPLGGNTRFEFGVLNKVDMLVVGNGNSVCAYRVRP